jgi:predicted SAM-dependent methyltransferase
MAQSGVGTDLDFSRTRISPNRKLTSYSKLRWAIGGFLRRTRLFAAKVHPGAYVHLGSGPNILKSFVNVDHDWVPGLDICCDITRGIPIADEIVGGIYSEHCLEHLTLEDGRFVLGECHRLLIPKSILRIVVPDLQLYARAYVRYLDGEAVTFPNEHFVNMTGVNRPVALFNELFLGSGHRFIYDYETLSSLLRGAGFSDIRRCAFRTGADARLLVDSAGRESESLYVEAIKG